MKSDRTILLILLMVLGAIIIKIILDRILFPLILVGIFYGLYISNKNKTPPGT